MKVSIALLAILIIGSGAASIDGLNLNLPDANSLLAPAINKINSQISSLVNPLIDELSAEVIKGNTVLQCYTNETGNASEVVTQIANQISSDTDNVLKIISASVSSVTSQANAILAKAKQCPNGIIGEITCLTPAVSAQLLSVIKLIFLSCRLPNLMDWC